MSDYTGRELTIYKVNTNRLRMLNLHGNGLIGRVDVHYDSTWVEDDEEGGYYSVSRRDERFFYFKDHLGSIRMTLEENSEIVSAQDYYPYGEILRSYTLGSGANNKYFFTEKERDTETNYDYFGARFYDSELIRWTTIDPLWEKYHGWSPYNYTLNNPLRFIDPDGREAVKAEPEDREGNGEERKKKLKEQQEEKANQDLSTDLLFISAGASGALAGGFNIDGGIIIDTKTGDAKFYFSWGFTAGFGTNAGGSITYKPNSILPENSGLTFNNDSKIEGTAYGVSINVTMNSPDQAFGSNGGGVGGGPKGGAGIFWHNTMLIVTTEKFNIVKGFRGVSENSDSKFWKK